MPRLLLRHIKIFLLIGFSLGSLTLSAQKANKVFGGNRVNYKKIDWQVFVAEDFEIYYYKGGQRHARFAAEYANEQFGKIADMVGFTPYTRIRLFIYNSKSDIKQSNIDYAIPYYEAGGETNLVNRSVEIAFPGTNEEFQYEIRYGIAKTLINEMMYGGSFKDVIQSAYLLSLPTWYLEGAAEYIARGWSITMDDYVRDLIITDRFDKPSKVDEREAKYIGQSLWNYIAIRFGKNNISSILNLTRVLRNPENSITNTVGVPYQVLIKEWKDYYSNQAYKVLNNSDMPLEENMIRKRNRAKRIYRDVIFSPDGNYLAYSENNKGRYKIIVEDRISGKKKVIHRRGSKSDDRRVNYDLPVMAWQSNSKLTFIDVRQDKLYRHSYDTEENKKEKFRPYIFNNINDISFSSNGSTMLISAEINGQTDIYTYFIRNNSLRRITSDYYDDIQPSFFPNDDKKFVFVSNRKTDSLDVNSEKSTDIKDSYNMYLYDADSSRTRVFKLKDTYFHHLKPKPISENEVLYLSDENGIFNLYKLDLRLNQSVRITDYQQNIRAYDYSPQSGEWATVMRNGNAEKLYIIPFLDTEKIIDEVQSTGRKEWISTGGKANAPKVTQSNNLININRVPKEKKVEALEMDEIDLENFVFESEKDKKELPKVVETPKSEIERILAKLERSSKTSQEIRGPYEGANRLRAENVITALVADNLRGLGGVVEYGLSDLFGKHKFKFGGIIFFDFKSHDVYAEYKYLKNLVDITARVDRTRYRYDLFENAIFHDYLLHEGSLDFALPLSDALRISAAPFFTQTIFRNSSLAALSASDFITNYAGLDAAIVYDNTRNRGVNLRQGSKAMVHLKAYDALGNNSKSFNRFTIDIRNYQPIHEEITLATRVSYGNFFGNNPKNFLLGGVDNWLIARKQQAEGPLTNDVQDPLIFNREDLLFTDFSTTLRGFPLNKMRGEEYFLANLELHIPIVQYLTNGPISSSFFRNMQLIGFTDFGSAWTGKNPLNGGNSINTETFDANSFQIVTRNYQNPFLYSYGAGLHTSMLGYYVRTDLAYGVENYKRQKPMLHIALGYDF